MGLSSPPVLVIDASSAARERWREVWRARQLLFFLARRDLSLRYKQTLLGVGWAVARPLVTMLVFVVVFGLIAKLPSEGAPYGLMVLAALLPWTLFSSALNETSASLVANASLLQKVYFPRLVLPLSALAVALVDFAVTFLLLVVIMAALGYAPGPRLVALPALLLLTLALALGLGLWFAALNVRWRDMRHIVQVLLQLALYLSPVGYSSTLVPEQWRSLFVLNPIVGVIEGFRWMLIPGAFPLRTDALAASVAIAVVALGSGLWYFRRTERHFADLI
jgi:lipopolysaccharide transport system permease protein